jgi:leucyl/phenylalanyl-tRNA--protein transferase
VALVRFVHAFKTAGGRLLDVQWATDHLSSLGAETWSRARYLAELERALTLPPLSIWSPGGTALAD